MPVSDWLNDTSVLCEITKITDNREVYAHNYGDKFPRRKLYAHGSDHMRYILNRLTSKGKGMKLGVCSNVIDFRKLKPPMLQKMMSPEWRTWVDDVYKENICNPEIYLSKNLIWDIDAEGEPMKAFYQGEKLCAHLKGLGFDPMIVFSGSKGFHVWLNKNQSTGLADKHFSDFKEDNAKFLAKVYCEVVKNLFKEATGDDFRNDDLTPVERQGIIACPYSIHWKTGQIVWPLDARNLQAIRKLESDAMPLDIAKAIHTQPNGQLWDTDVHFTDNPMYFSPCHTVYQRGMPLWEGLDV